MIWQKYFGITFDLYHLYKIQEQLEYLYDEKKLDEAEKNYYIESNKLLKQYIDEAFAKGE